MRYEVPLSTTSSFELAPQQARLATGKSQSKVARERRTSQSVVSEMESGSSWLPSAAAATSLALSRSGASTDPRNPAFPAWGPSRTWTSATY